MDKDLLSFKEACQYLDVSSSWLYKQTSNKAIPFVKPNGGKLYFLKSDLENWVLGNKKKDVKNIEDGVFNYLNKSYGKKKNRR